MPESIDWPRPRPPRRRRRIFAILAVFVGVVFGCRIAFSYNVDALWFGSLSYGAEFWKTQGIQWAAFTAFAAVTFLILYGSFLALKRLHLAELRSGQTIFIGGREVRLPVEPVLRFIARVDQLLVDPVAAALRELVYVQLSRGEHHLANRAVGAEEAHGKCGELFQRSRGHKPLENHELAAHGCGCDIQYVLGVT
jgi:hypothetical protein